MPQEQFLKAYEDFADALFRHCYLRVFSREHAKDLVQETFVRTWAYITEGKEIQNIRAFLYRTLRNLIVDASRKKKMVSLDALQEEQNFDPGEDGRPKVLERLEGREALHMLAKLDDAHREALTLRYVDDLLPKEIAHITGESENVISVRIHRGLKKLRVALNHAQNT